MRRVTKYFAVIELAMLLALPGVLRLLGRTGSEIENRARVDTPQLSVGSALEERTYADLADYFTDQLPMRAQAVRADAWIDYHVFGDSPSSDVRIGRDDWFFLTEELVTACKFALTARDVHARVDLVDRLVRAGGRELRFVVAPDKVSIHADKLGSVLPDDRCSLEKGIQLRKVLEHTPLPVVPLWELLHERAGHDLAYDPRGTHWTDGARVEVARTLLASLPGASWYTSDVVSRGLVDNPDELSALIGLPRSTKLEKFEIVRSGITTHETPDPPGRNPVLVDEFTSTSGGTRSLVTTPTLMLRDSQFGLMSRRFFAGSFASLRSFHWDAIGLPELRTALDQSTLVVVESTERDLWDRFSGDVFDQLVTLLLGRARPAAVEVDASEVRGARRAGDDGWVLTGRSASVALAGPASSDDRLVLLRHSPGATVTLRADAGAAVGAPWSDRDPPTAEGHQLLWIPAGTPLDGLVIEIRGDRSETIGVPLVVELPATRLR
jgi:hypothetical protein